MNNLYQMEDKSLQEAIITGLKAVDHGLNFAIQVIQGVQVIIKVSVKSLETRQKENKA
jgi:hypothetical protein